MQPKGEKFEDTKRVIKNCKSKDRQYNGQNKNIKMTNNDLQNTTEKTKDWATRIQGRIDTSNTHRSLYLLDAGDFHKTKWQC